MHSIESRAYYIGLSLFLLWLFLLGAFSVEWFGGTVRFFTTYSSSMAPTITPGSLLVSARLSPEAYARGDIGSFYTPSAKGATEIVTHRIVQIGGNLYLTKGDANEPVDPAILIPRYIIGKTVLVIPYVGSLVSFTKTLVGMYIAVIIPAACFGFAELWRILVTARKLIETRYG